MTAAETASGAIGNLVEYVVRAVHSTDDTSYSEKWTIDSGAMRYLLLIRHSCASGGRGCQIAAQSSRRIPM